MLPIPTLFSWTSGWSLALSYALDPSDFRKLISILVDENTYSNSTVRSKIETYADNISGVLDNTQVVIIPFPVNTSAFEIASLNESLYFEWYKSVSDNINFESKLVWTVLVWNFDLPVVYKDNESSRTILPFTDFEDKSYIYNHVTNKYEENEENVDWLKAEVWHWVISANWDLNKLNDYFDKNNDFYKWEWLFKTASWILNGDNDDKNDTFTVKADVMGGAGEKVQFTLDNVIDITAVASKYNAVSITNTDFSPAGSVDIDAGELTLYAIDAERDEIRQDKTNVVLGQLKVVNVAGQNLELQNLGVVLTATNSGIIQVVENVEFEVNGTSYDLSTPTTTNISAATYSDTDLDITIPQGTTILTVRADTLDNLTDGTTVTMSLDASSTTTFKVEEVEDDVTVSDITPSNLSWDNVEVVLSAASISNVTLGDLDVVKGASDLVALQFEIEAGDASYVSTDRIKVTLKNHSGGVSAITKTEVSEVALYKGSVSESNLLDKLSGSKLDTNGVATFDGFDVEIAADTTETFVVTVSTVDTDDVVGAQIVASIANPSTDVSLEDDENDTVTLSTVAISDKVITILDSGDLELTGKLTLTDNEDEKVVLAGTESIIYSVVAKSTNEMVKAETVEFTLSGAIQGTGSFRNVITSAKLYLGSDVVATATNSDVSSTSANGIHNDTTSKIKFENISDLVFPTSDTELKLAIVTQEIGQTTVEVSRDGLAVSDLQVTNVVITDAEGDDSAEDVTPTYDTVNGTTSNLSQIVPVKVTPSVTSTFSTTGDASATLSFAVDDGDNTDNSGSDIDVNLTQLHFAVSNFSASGTMTVKNSDNTIIGTGTVVDGNFNITLSTTEVITSWEVINLSVSTSVDAEFDLKAKGATFTADGKTYTTVTDSAQSVGAYLKAN